MNLTDLENKVKGLDLYELLPTINNTNDLIKVQRKRSQLINELLSVYIESKKENTDITKILDLITQFFSVYLTLNPFKVDIDYFGLNFSNMRENEIREIKRFFDKNQDFEDLYNKLTNVDYDQMIRQYLNEIGGETNELIYNVPKENMFNLLLDFSEVLVGSTKSKEINEDEYVLNFGGDPYWFKIIEKEQNKKIVYEYDIKSSVWGETGKFYIEFMPSSPGTVKMRTRNVIESITEESRNNFYVANLLGKFLKTFLDLVIGKVVAKQVQTIIYERSLDDMTIRNYRILQSKINEMGKNIEDLKNKFYEVKASPLLTSFNCSECGAILNITSNDEKFIVCEYCNSPFLIEWQ